MATEQKSSPTIVVVSNPHASHAAEAAPLYALLRERPDVLVCETSGDGDVDELCARYAATAQYRFAAGGDGTVHEVVNRLHQHGGGAALGILPLGTANDFSRTLGVPLDDPAAAFALAERGVVRAIDLVRLRTPREECVFANLASGGNADKVQDHLTPEMKERWGPLAYLHGAVQVLRDLTAYDVELTLDDEPPMALQALNLMIANGRTGGATPVAPQANPEDGLLEVIAVRTGDAIDFASTTAHFLIGDYLQHEQVFYRRARQVRINARPSLTFTTDGERVEDGPFEFEVLPGAIRALVGPAYVAEPPA